ncbi:MAG: bifunctional aspartate kinase/homoserine dehydrogenase I [Polaribacter sp.]|uniref:bifunctional aspartate kinase/homoserine dehydrogenase I n=1 Tax=Polaribacter sp. TaxID=1920175 RepID=UPI003BB0F1DD
MKNQLQHITIHNFTTESGLQFLDLQLSYQLFGQELGSAPVVLVNHALTGNSNVAGENGWWKDIIGIEKTIDTNNYTILSFNIPGNGFDGFVIEDYKSFIARDIAKIFLIGLKELKVDTLFALIGGSLGGGIAWEMMLLNTKLTQHFIPVATDWKSTDWLIANCQIQEQFLVNSSNPVHDARMHAMLCYRTPESFKERFHRSKKENSEFFNVESWLLHHGKKLQERYQLSSYKLMNQLLKSIDVTKNGKISESIFDKIEADIHIIGVDSDLFFTAEENRQTHKKLALTKENVTYNEINSVHGHDAFLIEYDQLQTIIEPIFNKDYRKKRMKVIKFGGKSLANGKGLENSIAIIKNKYENKEKITVVASARGNTTNDLEAILQKAAAKTAYKNSFEKFKEYQLEPNNAVDFSQEFLKLDAIFEGVSLLGDYSQKIKDEVLAQGELLAVKLLVSLLEKENIAANATDARTLIITDENFGNAQPILAISKENTIAHFKKNKDVIHIITGFIASNKKGETTTLGRNGSNYTAALLANFLDADELQNYTHVSGIFTANPDLVVDAKKIEQLSFSEANELANFGATILHAKTIIPLLEKNINLRILNTFNKEDKGTLITAEPSSAKGIKSISTINNVALLNFEGRGLLGKVGVDARIFRALSDKNISISIISQGSSERGIGLIINADRAQEAVEALENEFENDFYSQDVNQISIVNDVAVISIIGQDLSEFHLPYNALIKNQIIPLLFNNTVTGKNVSLVVKKTELNKAVNVIHGQVFGVTKKINIAIFGKGLVGATLINQIIENTQSVLERRKLQLNVFAVANSKKVLLNKNGVTQKWKEDLLEKGDSTISVEDIIAFAKEYHLENLIAVDNTASVDFVSNYIPLIEAGFDLVSCNKIANTLSFDFYKELRAKLKEYKKQYLYETNVGAGLPLIDTIRLLHESGENITKIRGVFSGTLSYLFNNFSEKNVTFSSVLKEAIDKGFTEPDPREDLGGNDVARKLLILARELELENELNEVEIKNLISENLRGGSVDDFLNNLDLVNEEYQALKDNQKPNHVLRYIGELSGDLSQEKGILEVKLVSTSVNSPLGSLKGSDAIFEIYTESYGEQPIVIQGAGAGAKVTARGVFGDILRLAKHNN